MMNSLQLDIQNSPENIHLLAAQNQLYYEGKKIFLRQFIFTVPVTVLLSLTKILFITILHIDINWLPAAYGILLVIADWTLIGPAISRRRSDAAKIQEAFDTTLFNLSWNGILVGKQPEIETVNRYYRRFQDRDKTGTQMQQLYDWYPEEVKHSGRLKAILICQKSSVNYDFSLRERFKTLVFVSAVVTFLLLIGFALLENLPIQIAIVQVFFPFLPVLVLSLKLHQEHGKSNNNLFELKALLSSQLSSAESDPSPETIRRIQDRIYLNRKDSPLIPERFYRRLRDRLERDMHDNASAMLP